MVTLLNNKVVTNMPPPKKAGAGETTKGKKKNRCTSTAPYFNKDKILNLVHSNLRIIADHDLATMNAKKGVSHTNKIDGKREGKTKGNNNTNKQTPEATSIAYPDLPNNADVLVNFVELLAVQWMEICMATNAIASFAGSKSASAVIHKKEDYCKMIFNEIDFVIDEIIAFKKRNRNKNRDSGTGANGNVNAISNKKDKGNKKAKKIEHKSKHKTSRKERANSASTKNSSSDKPYSEMMKQPFENLCAIVNSLASKKDANERTKEHYENLDAIVNSLAAEKTATVKTNASGIVSKCKSVILNSLAAEKDTNKRSKEHHENLDAIVNSFAAEKTATVKTNASGIVSKCNSPNQTQSTTIICSQGRRILTHDLFTKPVRASEKTGVPKTNASGIVSKRKIPNQTQSTTIIYPKGRENLARALFTKPVRASENTGTKKTNESGVVSKCKIPNQKQSTTIICPKGREHLAYAEQTLVDDLSRQVISLRLGSRSESEPGKLDASDGLDISMKKDVLKKKKGERPESSEKATAVNTSSLDKDEPSASATASAKIPEKKELKKKEKELNSVSIGEGEIIILDADEPSDADGLSEVDFQQLKESKKKFARAFPKSTRKDESAYNLSNKKNCEVIILDADDPSENTKFPQESMQMHNKESKEKGRQERHKSADKGSDNNLELQPMKKKSSEHTKGTNLAKTAELKHKSTNDESNGDDSRDENEVVSLDSEKSISDLQLTESDKRGKDGRTHEHEEDVISVSPNSNSTELKEASPTEKTTDQPKAPIREIPTANKRQRRPKRKREKDIVKPGEDSQKIMKNAQNTVTGESRQQPDEIEHFQDAESSSSSKSASLKEPLVTKEAIIPENSRKHAGTEKTATRINVGEEDKIEHTEAILSRTSLKVTTALKSKNVKLKETQASSEGVPGDTPSRTPNENAAESKNNQGKQMESPKKTGEENTDDEYLRIKESIPLKVRRDFKQQGFTMYVGRYQPILQLGPYDMAALRVRKQWFDMFEKKTKQKKPLHRLVYWYGTDLEEAFSFIPSNKIVSHKNGVKRGLDKIPPSIQRKLNGNKQLNGTEKIIVDGLSEMEEDAKYPPEKRALWLLSDDDDDETESEVDSQIEGDEEIEEDILVEDDANSNCQKEGKVEAASNFQKKGKTETEIPSLSLASDVESDTNKTKTALSHCLTRQIRQTTDETRSPGVKDDLKLVCKNSKDGTQEQQSIVEMEKKQEELKSKPNKNPTFPEVDKDKQLESNRSVTDQTDKQNESHEQEPIGEEKKDQIGEEKEVVLEKNNLESNRCVTDQSDQQNESHEEKLFGEEKEVVLEKNQLESKRCVTDQTDEQNGSHEQGPIGEEKEVSLNQLESNRSVTDQTDNNKKSHEQEEIGEEKEVVLEKNNLESNKCVTDQSDQQKEFHEEELFGEEKEVPLNQLESNRCVTDQTENRKESHEQEPFGEEKKDQIGEEKEEVLKKNPGKRPTDPEEDIQRKAKKNKRSISDIISDNNGNKSEIPQDSSFDFRVSLQPKKYVGNPRKMLPRKSKKYDLKVYKEGSIMMEEEIEIEEVSGGKFTKKIQHQNIQLNLTFNLEL